MSPTGLFEFGGYEIPSTLIAEGGYEILPNQRQDLDPYTDQFGVTQRNALAHTKTQVTITTRAGLTWNEVLGLYHGISSNYVNSRERSANCKYIDTEFPVYDETSDSYYFPQKSGKFYLDPSFSSKIRTYKMRSANGQWLPGKFESLTLIFIEF